MLGLKEIKRSERVYTGKNNLTQLKLKKFFLGIAITSNTTQKGLLLINLYIYLLIMAHFNTNFRHLLGSFPGFLASHVSKSVEFLQDCK